MTAPSAQGRALAAGLLLALLWGASFSIQKAAYTAMGAAPFLFCRAGLMAALALALLALSRRPLWPRLDASEWRLLLVATLLGQLAHISLVTFGIHWSTPFSSAVIMACGPVITLVLLRLLHGVRLRPPQVLGVGVALAGVLLFLADKLMKTELRASGGDLLMLLGTAVFSLYTIRVVPLVRRHGGTQIMCWTTLLAAPFMMAGTGAQFAQAPLAQLAPGIWLAVAWTVVVSAFAGWLIWSWINVVRGVARTAPLLYLVPPVAGVIGWLVMGETLGPWKIAGGVVALAGVALAQWAGPSAVVR
ncbi:MAG TPA: DMT family transporter [Ramlibacter sp.]|nr:DMT family transporter [Ramlibacter sp.]